MDSDKIPSRPVITSQVAAEEHWRRWIQANTMNQLIDHEGTKWTVDVEQKQGPHPVEPRRGVWSITLNLSTTLTSQELLKTDVLDGKQDSRFLSLLGNVQIPMRMRPIRIEAGSAEESRTQYVAALDRLKSEFSQYSLISIKRKLLARYIEQAATFGFNHLETLR